MKSVLAPSETKFYFVRSEQPTATLYFSFMPSYAAKLKEAGAGVIFFGESFVFGLIGNNKSADLIKELEAAGK